MYDENIVLFYNSKLIQPVTKRAHIMSGPDTDGRHIARRSAVYVIREQTNRSFADEPEALAVRNVIDQLRETQDRTEENIVLFNLVKTAYLTDANEGVRVSAANHLLEIALRIRRDESKQNVLDDVAETLANGMHSVIDQPFTHHQRNFDYINYSMDALSAIGQSPFKVVGRASAMARGFKKQIPTDAAKAIRPSYITLTLDQRKAAILAVEQRQTAVVCQPS